MENIQDTSCGKTYRERFQAIRGETSMPSFRKSVPCATVTYLSLDLRKTSGLLPEKSWEMVTQSHGERLTLNTGECPSVVRESTLSQILQADAPEKYYLSPKLARGYVAEQ